MLYSLLIHTNVEILERHSQRVIPSYSEPGIHVLVNDLQDQDFIVFNPNDFSYTVEAKLTDDSIMMALHSIEQKTNIHTKVDMEEINYRTIYRYSKNLSPGEEVKIQNGENGSRIIVYRIWKNSSGETIKTEQISSDYYAPSPEIILRGVPENNQSIDEKINDEETTAPSNHDQKNQDENEKKQIDDQLNDHANENEEANSENTIYEKPNYVK